MKRKHLFVILAALALGLLLYAPSLIRSPDGRPEPGGGGFALEGIRPTAIERIRILHADGDSAHLARTEDGWRTNGWEADSSHVANLLAAIDTMRAERVVARNPDNHARLQVTGETGRTVELQAESGRSWSFLVGTRDLGTGGYHVRLPEDDRVWLLQGPVGGYTGRAIENWRERHVTRLDTARVREIVMRREGSETALRRSDGAWTLGDGVTADTAVTRRLLGRLSALRSADFPADSIAGAADFSRPEAVLSVFGSGQGDVPDREPLVSLRFVRVTEDGPWLVKRAGEPEVFELAEVAVEELLPEAATLTGAEEEGRSG